MTLGRPQALGAVFAAGLAGWITVATTTRFADSATRFVWFGLAIFLLAVVLGSRFAVGGAVLVALTGAAIEIGTVPVQRWDRSFAIACLWYVAAELAWDSMERRDGRHRSLAVDIERTREVATVVAATLVATVMAAALVGSAPPRSLVVLAAAVAALALGLVTATRRLLATGEPMSEPAEQPTRPEPAN